jgi:hypothetical protein
VWYEKPRKDGLLDGNNQYARKAPRKPGIETPRTSYDLETRWNSKRPSGGQRDWKSKSKLPDLLSHCKEVNTGHCGEVDPLQNEKRSGKLRRNR